MVASGNLASLKPRHIPQRSCIACRQAQPKRRLLRLVRTAAGLVEVDLTGKKSGRGAYLCQDSKCWEEGLRRNRLDHALRTRIAAAQRAPLAEFFKSLVRQADQSGNI